MDRLLSECSPLSGRGDKVRGGLIVATNREPYSHRKTAQGVKLEVPTGGLVSALDTVLRITGGTWIAWGSGNGDRESADDACRLMVPPENPAYTLRRVWLDPRMVGNYYHGFCNRVLWPLFHGEPGRVIFRESYWDAYEWTNRVFAEAILAEGGDASRVWIHDYHLCLVPRMLREMGTERTIAHFWHIHWPGWELFRTSPHGADLLAGLLGNDLIGFQIPRHARNFLECAEACLGVPVDYQAMTVTWDGRTVRVRVFPVSTDYHRFEHEAASVAAALRIGRIRKKRRFPALVGIAVDRLDYTKGLIERLQAIDLFFQRYRRFQGAFTFFQVAIMTRSGEPYASYRKEVEELIARINGSYATAVWQPIVCRSTRLEFPELVAHYRLADVAIVTPLCDGMNLVAKEYAAARVDGEGVLILGRDAGAAEELDGALIIDPGNIEEFVAAIHQALTMRLGEKRARMARLRARLQAHTIHHWIGEILDEFSLLPLIRQGARHALEHGAAITACLAGRELFLCLDFDGTLAPIVECPEQAELPTEVRSLLIALSVRHPVAIISGRSLADLQERVGIPGLIYLGNHGAEAAENEGGGSGVFVARPLLEDFLGRARRALERYQGAIVEDKGATASIHFRKIKPALLGEFFAAFREIARDYAGKLRITEGRKVFEIRPFGAGDKGEAVMRLMGREGRGMLPLYVGDDATDEDAFRAIRGDGISVAVGGSPEADYYLRNQGEMRELLELIARAATCRS
jgi:trehalose 6-phosphate synthase/phosphatase